MLRVPEAALLSKRSALRDAALSGALQTLVGVKLRDRVLLASHLLHEVSKGPSSSWHAYLRVLPPAYTTLACFSTERAQHLQVSMLYSDTSAHVSCLPRAAIFPTARTTCSALDLGS